MASYVTMTIWSIFCDGHSKNVIKKHELLAQKETFLVTTNMKTMAKSANFNHGFHPDHD